ncbi:MAG: hypothetical protein IJP29_01485 [Lachnospiraceae bacterium]|nr:hypothetical protein [Lachnospiraceae bacterium]
MKLVKRLVIAGLFICSVFALMIPLSYALRPLNEANVGTRNRITGFYAEPDDSMNVVIVGNSGLYRYVNNPYLYEQKGLTSYCFAFSGYNIFFAEGLIEEMLKTQSPELIILDARKFVLTEDDSVDPIRAQRVFNNIKYSSIRCEMINRAYPNPLDRIVNYFDIALYHDNWEQLNWERLEFADNEKKNTLKGFQIVPKVVPMNHVDVSGIEEKVPISEASEETLRSILEMCQEEGLEIMLLSTPWMISEEEQKKSNYINDIVEEYGYSYLDMNANINEIGLDFANDFYDEKHVNVIGSEKVTDYLGDYIMERYEFDMEHDEVVVKSWEKAVTSYNKKMKKYRK